MYYLNEDGKRVYTLKVPDYCYRGAFVSFVVGGDMALFVVISRARVLDPKKILLAFFLVSDSSI